MGWNIVQISLFFFFFFNSIRDKFVKQIQEKHQKKCKGNLVTPSVLLILISGHCFSEKAKNKLNNPYRRKWGEKLRRAKKRFDD